MSSPYCLAALLASVAIIAGCTTHEPPAGVGGDVDAPVPAAAQSVGALMDKVCLPLAVGSAPQADVIRGAGLWKLYSPPSLVGSTPLNFYGGPYRGVRGIWIDPAGCVLNLATDDFPAMNAMVESKLGPTPESWRLIASTVVAGGTRRAYCSASDPVILTTTEQPAPMFHLTGKSFEVRVERLAPDALAIRCAPGQ